MSRQTLDVYIWFNYFLHSAACTDSVTNSKTELLVQACFNVHELNLVKTPCSVFGFQTDTFRTIENFSLSVFYHLGFETM